MQIITLENDEFPLLLDAFRSAKTIGRYTRGSEVHLVKVTEHFVLVMNEFQGKEIALRPVRNVSEATTQGTHLLEKERLSGARVELA